MSQIWKKKPNDSGHPHNTTDAKTTRRCVTTDSPKNKFRPTLFSYSRTPTQASSGNRLRPGQLSGSQICFALPSVLLGEALPHSSTSFGNVLRVMLPIFTSGTLLLGHCPCHSQPLSRVQYLHHITSTTHQPL